jgi:chemotaxis protein MotA
MVNTNSTNKDISTIIGLAIGFGGLIAGFILDGGNILGFLRPTALIMIPGGTIGAIVVSNGFTIVLRIPPLVVKSLTISKEPRKEIADLLWEFSNKSRRPTASAFHCRLWKQASAHVQ